MLETAVLNSFFLFNDDLYQQIDGVGMGLPLGPTFANIFLCFHEQQWLKNCPAEFRPACYRRYVDDCFLIFNDRSHVDKFLAYLNSQHPKIHFTKEIENKGCLSFLDINLSRQKNKLEMSIYRKPTFTGLGLSFFSFIPATVKKAVIHSAVFRAFRLSSSYKLFDVELNFLKDFFRNNGFPRHLIESVIKGVLDKIFISSSPPPSVPKLEKYIVLPYFGAKSVNLQRDICDLLTQYYPYMNPKIVLRNRFTVSSLFKFKDRIPKCLRSGIVYQYRCSSCEESYIGSTYVRLYTRVCEHKGIQISDRTQNMLSSPKNSAIREHSHTCDTPFSIDDFTVLDAEPFPFSLRLLESLYIHKHRPKINGTSSCHPLTIVK